MYQFPQKYQAAQRFSIFIRASWAPNQHITRISEGSCDTQDWNRGSWKFSFYITEINYILKYIKIEYYYFKL